MPPNSVLKDAAYHLLDVIAAELEVRGIEVPEVRFVHAGQLAHDWRGSDCASAFVVAWQSSVQGQVGQAGGIGGEPLIRCAMPLTAGFEIALLRCVPSMDSEGNPPTVDALEESANEILEDAMTLPAVIVDLVGREELLDQPVQIAGIGGVRAVGPQGGVGGCTLRLDVTLLTIATTGS